MRIKTPLILLVFALGSSIGYADTDNATCGGDFVDPFLDAMDCSADPCVDFYAYACGGWLQKNPLPGDRARFGRFDELQDRNLGILKDALEKASVNDSKRKPNDQKIGDLYASCMDEAARNKLGLAPIKNELAAIDASKSKADLLALIPKLHDSTFAVFFNFYSEQDKKDATKVIANVDQGGMKLPSRDYYFDTDAKAKQIREKYVKHIAKVLGLSGTPAKQARAQAQAVLAVETSLAKNALKPVERRDPQRVYHLKPVSELQKLTPSIDWANYMQIVGTPPVTEINVAVIEFNQGLENVLAKTKIEDLKAYMRWFVLADSAPLLSRKFEDESFDFSRRTLAGQKEMRPRWHRCTVLVDNLLGEALGQAFVEKAFSGDSKERTLKLIANLEKALDNEIDADLDWMTPATKHQAKIKLKAIAKKIGYPDKWRDYSSVDIIRGELFNSAAHAAKFEQRRQLAKIGKPVDKDEWLMTPSTVNAYYEPQNNNINFPAGILQPPFFHKDWDDARNYGAIGMVIGHEITHGFDDQGRQFDAKGNLRDWWTQADAKAFNERAQCFVDQYGRFVAVKDPKGGDVLQDGKLTLGENAADNGGMRIAWNAFMDYAAGAKQPPKDDLSPEKRFFLAYGQIWCSNQTDEYARQFAKTNPHSAPRSRVNDTVANMPEFQRAFACKTGQPMSPEKRCRIW